MARQVWGVSNWVSRLPKLYNRGFARAAIIGKEPTMNPTPAAAALLGMNVVRPQFHRVSIARRHLRKKKHERTANPVPAVLSLLGGGGFLGGLSKRFKAPSEKRAAGLVPALVASANSGNLTAVKGLIERANKPMIAKESAVWKAAAAQIAPAMVALAIKNNAQIPAADQSGPEQFSASVLASPFTAQTGAGAGGGALAQYGALLNPGTVNAVAKAVSTSTRRRSSRSRYPTYTDRYGRQRYSTKPPGSEMRLPAGATMAAGTPYNFFTGAIGKGGAGATAGQLGVAAVAGTAAYFATKAILKYFGGKAVAAEEAGVQLALAARAARYEYAMEHNLRGSPPSYGVPAAKIKEIGNAMKAKLAELGYNEHGVRTRSGTENFLSTYGE